MAKQTTRQIVYEAIVELHNQEQTVTRETLSSYIDLPLTTIDERIKSLINDGEVERVDRGVYRPVRQHAQTRPISQTELPDGTVILDVGDEVMKLTPREARMLGTMLAARAMQAGQIELGKGATTIINSMELKIKELERKLSRSRKEEDKSNQLNLGV